MALFREAPILQDIDWKVQAGEHWALLGPNGSGKTTLIAALTAYRTPSRGSIEVLGETYGTSDWRDLRKKIGVVSLEIAQMIQPGETAFQAVLSGRSAMVNFWGTIGETEAREARRILREVQAEKIADRPWAYLSQGERQRVLIGRALMAKYRLLILDEPCAGLDLVARERFLRFLSRLAKKRGAPTLILITHHVEEILPVFTHVLILAKGKVLASGKRSAVLNSKNLSQAFGTKISLTQKGQRYAAKLRKPGGTGL